MPVANYAGSLSDILIRSLFKVHYPPVFDRQTNPAVILMLKKERQAFILHQVNLHNKVLSTSLSDEMDVSEDTSRRWLQEVTGEGCIIKYTEMHYHIHLMIQVAWSSKAVPNNLKMRFG